MTGITCIHESIGAYITVPRDRQEPIVLRLSGGPSAA